MEEVETSEQRPQDYLADIGFDELNISPEVRRALAERGYVHPTPVQAKAFAPVMEGRDLIVRSKTGTGKTAAFGLPMLEKIPAGERKDSRRVAQSVKGPAFKVERLDPLFRTGFARLLRQLLGLLGILDRGAIVALTLVQKGQTVESPGLGVQIG